MHQEVDQLCRCARVCEATSHHAYLTIIRTTSIETRMLMPGNDYVCGTFDRVTYDSLFEDRKIWLAGWNDCFVTIVCRCKSGSREWTLLWSVFNTIWHCLTSMYRYLMHSLTSTHGYLMHSLTSMHRCIPCCLMTAHRCV